MRILLFLFAAVLLAGCATQGGGPRAVAAPKQAEPAKPPSCRDAQDAWDWYLAGNVSARALITCAGIAGTVDPMLSLALTETNLSASRPEFERTVGFLRLLARSGEDRAQRALSGLYAGKQGWYGRNAYLSLFWRGVVRKRDPSYRLTPADETKLDRFQRGLTADAAGDLKASIAQWSPNNAVPNRLTIDSFLTYVIESGGRVALPTRSRIIDYGSEQNLEDWRMMFLMANQRRLSTDQRAALFQQESAKGSIIALLFELSDAQKAETPDDGAVVRKFLELLLRLGLDPSSFQPELLESAVSVDANGTMADLEALLRGRSRPEQRTVALISLLAICGDGPSPLCGAAAERFDPILPRAARNVGRIVAVTQQCTGDADTLRCMIDNNVLGSVRDLFALDYRDFSGQET